MTDEQLIAAWEAAKAKEATYKLIHPDPREGKQLGVFVLGPRDKYKRVSTGTPEECRLYIALQAARAFARMIEASAQNAEMIDAGGRDG